MNLLNLMQMFNQNPLAILQRRFNLPQGMNSPDQIINHLLETGQITQSQLDQVRGMGNMFRK